MRSIKAELTPELRKKTDPRNVAKSEAFLIKTYRQLVKQVAKLSFLNKDYLFFFRGQSKDYKNKVGATTLYPTIYRDEYLQQREVNYRFEVLNQACYQLKALFKKKKIEGFKELGRRKYIQWSILQHYQVYETPLLDLTHSLRVACSFAQINNNGDHGYVFVLGLPYFTNRISVNSEHEVVNIRLLSISPPEALRPYFQEGYLVGTEDITSEYNSKSELDFKRRLIVKFKIENSKKFWGRNFTMIPESLLCPKKDRVAEICKKIKVEVNKILSPGQIGDFILQWVELESKLVKHVKLEMIRIVSIREAIRILFKWKYINESTLKELDELRKFRNIIVHEPQKIESAVLEKYINKVKNLKKRIKISF